MRLESSQDTLIWPSVEGERAEITVASDRRALRSLLSPSRSGRVRGVFGNFSDDGSGDVATPTGAVLNSATFQELYASFVERSRNALEESFFDYAQGERTDTFTDRTLLAANQAKMAVPATIVARCRGPGSGRDAWCDLGRIRRVRSAHGRHSQAARLGVAGGYIDGVAAARRVERGVRDAARRGTPRGRVLE